MNKREGGILDELRMNVRAENMSTPIKNKPLLLFLTLFSFGSLVLAIIWIKLQAG